MLGINKGISMGNIKLLKIYIVQKHIDAAEVVGREINLLPKKALADIFFAQYFGKLQQ